MYTPNVCGIDLFLYMVRFACISRTEGCCSPKFMEIVSCTEFCPVLRKKVVHFNFSCLLHSGHKSSFFYGFVHRFVIWSFSEQLHLQDICEWSCSLWHPAWNEYASLQSISFTTGKFHKIGCHAKTLLGGCAIA